jgi:hypothetical protein
MALDGGQPRLADSFVNTVPLSQRIDRAVNPPTNAPYAM